MAQLNNLLVTGASRFLNVINGTITNSEKVNNHTVNSDVPANAVFTDTTYESKTAASGGTDLSLVTTGEKYTWNSKLNNLNKFYLTDATPTSASSGDLWFIIEEEE